MTEERPLIHPFRTPGGYYIYDTNKNTILKTSKDIYQLVSGKGTSIGKGVNPTVDKMLDEGFLSSNRAVEIVHPASDSLEYYLDSCVRKITLQVTQQCNLRCEYCSYSVDSSLQRNHASKKMSFETAKKGIDFLIDHSRDCDKINIGFYGGEPFLEFELIKKCIEYVKENFEGKEINYSITTNGTLLNDEIIGYLRDNDIPVVISLDGPREVHNKNRKFAGSGKGSFDTIVKNIGMLKGKHPDYFKKVTFNIVMDPENDFSCIADFFTDFDTVKDAMKTSTIMDTRYSGKDPGWNDAFHINYFYEVFKLYLHKLGRLDKEFVPEIIFQYFGSLKAKYHQDLLPAARLSEKTHHGGPCIPGQMRLFMDIEGNFLPCERVSETSQVMKIGHADTGFDIERCRQILNIGKLTETSCKNCWVIRKCLLCASAADAGSCLSKEKKLSYCSWVRGEIDSYFRDYCALREFGCSFDEENEISIMEL